MTSYCLKAMVLARLFAESTILIAFIAAPILLLLTGQMQHLELPVQVLFYCLAAVGLMILPWFGFLTWQVRVDENGLTADALFRHQFCAWGTMKKITRRASWNWQRYVIEYEGGSLHFPVLLAHGAELIQTIRFHLPDDAEVGLTDESPTRKFIYDPISRISEMVQGIVACVFVSVFWIFFSYNLHKHFRSPQDAAIVLTFCLAMTIVFIWRLVVVVMMPESIELTQDTVVFRSLFSTKALRWTDLKSLEKPLPLLPEGIVVKTTKGNIFVGSGLDASDEMQEIIVQELAQVRQDLAFIAAAKQRVGASVEGSTEEEFSEKAEGAGAEVVDAVDAAETAEAAERGETLGAPDGAESIDGAGAEEAADEKGTAPSELSTHESEVPATTPEDSINKRS